MASGKGILLGALGGLLLRESTVQAVRDVAACFRVVELAGPALRGVACRPGDKIQVLLPSREVRTFTPVRWDSEAGVTELLVHHREASPAGEWVRGLAVGDACRFLGPQRSLRVPARGPVVLFGDETSCAVARAVAAAVPEVDIVLEASHAEATRAALGDRAAQAVVVPRSADEAHLGRVVDHIAALLERRPGAGVLLTGRAQAIHGVRAQLKARALPPSLDNRAYWSPGRRGLD